MIHYILQVIVFQLLFLVVYDVFLKKETFFNWNRVYLLVAPILSFIVPLIKIDVLEQQIPQQYIITLPTVLLGASSTPQKGLQTFDPATLIHSSSNWSLMELAFLVWLIGVGIGMLLFGYKFFKIRNYKAKGTLVKSDVHNFVLLPETTIAFSFFNTIFIGNLLSQQQISHILLHEKVHVTEKHTYDLLFFETLKILFWFNPLSYFFQKRITSLHEFIADSKVVLLAGKSNYYIALLNQVFQTEEIKFINTFFNHSFIKKRITMLQKSKSNRIQLVKYLGIIPLVFMMVLYTSCTNEKADEQLETNVVSENDTEVMQKINELAEAIMKKGNLSDDEVRALKMLATESNEGDKVYTSVNEYLVEEVEEVPFASIEKVPSYPGCTGDNNELKKCFAKEVRNIVFANFNTDLANELGLKGKQRISVQFKIDQLGIITNIIARAPHPALEAEAKRVVSKIPQMIPGEEAGKKVAVLYSLPILFKVEE